jgi:phosphoglycerate dehydrogenase-like enzyme
MKQMLKGLFILNTDAFEQIYPSEIRNEIEELVDIYTPQQTAASILQNPSLLQEAEVIFSGWGGPRLDDRFLQAAPHLKGVFHGAGSIKSMVTDAFWERNIPITSSYAANAVPVAEYTLSQILFTLKSGWHYARIIKESSQYPPRDSIKNKVTGAYKSTVGIISLGMIGRHVCELLKNFDMNTIAYDPFVSQDEANRYHVELCSLQEIFERADVVSLHAPRIKETEGLITGKHFESMKQGASFINTSRGAIIKENEMIEVLRLRPDLQAVLDVTYPEPPELDSPLYTLPNVVLTPHIAGSINNECARMGKYAVEELKRYIHGEPLKWRISREKAAIMA